MRYFIQAKGFTVYEYVMYHEKISVILLDKMSAICGENGCELGSQRTKHIQVNYFLIKDHIADGDKTLEHCQIGKMLGDHFTKSLQGSMFRKSNS